MGKRGQKGEEIAANYLKDRGHYIVTRNYYCYRGEVDIISLDSNYVVFTEVKKRGPGSYFRPEESITRRKKLLIINCSKRWIFQNNYRGNVRFDVIAISGGEIRHYENAFQPQGYH